MYHTSKDMTPIVGYCIVMYTGVHVVVAGVQVC